MADMKRPSQQGGAEAPKPTGRPASRRAARPSAASGKRTARNAHGEVGVGVDAGGAPTGRRTAASGRRLGRSRSAAVGRPQEQHRTSRRAERMAGEERATARRHAGVRHVPEGMEGDLESTSIGEIRRSTERAERHARLQKTRQRYTRRIVIGVAVVIALIVGFFALRASNAFAITDVQVVGVTHLTNDEMAQMAAVPADTTLLRVDTETIRNRLLQNAWVLDAQVNRVFPHTLEISVTEREIAAIIEVQNASGSGVKSWAISSDHIWLMPIPDKNSEAAKTTSAQIYEDADAALHITDVPYGTLTEIGAECIDENVNNALDIVSGLTTELSDMVVSVSAAGPVETTLILDNGVEVAFGKAENIRDKERVILKILEDNPDGVAYINVRMVENPTWREV